MLSAQPTRGRQSLKHRKEKRRSTVKPRDDGRRRSHKKRGILLSTSDADDEQEIDRANERTPHTHKKKKRKNEADGNTQPRRFPVFLSGVDATGKQVHIADVKLPSDLLYRKENDPDPTPDLSKVYISATLATKGEDEPHPEMWPYTAKWGDNVTIEGYVHSTTQVG